MDISLLGTSQVKIDLGHRDLGSCYPATQVFPRTTSRICTGRSPRWRALVGSGSRFTSSAVRSEVVTSEKCLNNTSTPASRIKPLNGVRLYVGLPLDAVSDCNTITHSRAIAAGLKALKLLGVTGIELPVWWGIAEKEAMGKYEWSGYLALAEMVQNAGLKLHVSLCFHGSKEPKILLPKWVSQIGEANPNIYFAGRSGQNYKDCLSLGVDDLPVLNGKTPAQVYQEFCENFKSTFSAFMGSTITGISMGLGPDGELRYPSCHRIRKSSKIPGVGEFQCYDQNMLGLLKKCAERNGSPLWGLGGPHDAPNYDQLPNSSSFFKENGGSWETSYGDFFLSWYSSELISHGNRLLSLASTTFSDPRVKISGKIPLVHSWYKTRSHPSELTAGYYNTAGRDGYEAVAEMFARNSCKVILPGMDLADVHQPHGSMSSPEVLLAQIKRACKKHGVGVSGQNSSVWEAPKGFEQIQKNLMGEKEGVELFTYQRMGASFFSPKHFPLFSQFVRSFNQLELLSDDLPMEEEETAPSLCLNTESAKNLTMQAA